MDVRTRKSKREPGSARDTPGARKLFRGIAWLLFAVSVVAMGFTLRDELDGDVRTRSGTRRSSIRTISRANQPVNYRVTMLQHWVGAVVPACFAIIIYRKTAVADRTRRNGSSL
jgi:hypothetical protein